MTGLSPIRVVLFDLGNVLAKIDFDAFWRALGLKSVDAQSPYAAGYASWTRLYETGHLSTATYLHELRALFQNRFAEQELGSAFGGILLDPIPGMCELVAKVSQSHLTALVSNTNEIHYRISIERYEVLRFLQKHFLSYRLQSMKPAKEFYEAIIRDIGCDPVELFFVDDLSVNVEAARAAGFRGVRFENTDQLAGALRANGIGSL